MSGVGPSQMMSPIINDGRTEEAEAELSSIDGVSLLLALNEAADSSLLV